VITEIDREFLQRAIQDRLPSGSQVDVQFDASNLLYHVEANAPGTHLPVTQTITAKFVEDDRLLAVDFARYEILRRLASAEAAEDQAKKYEEALK
jgi:hypothetical protein